MVHPPFAGRRIVRLAAPAPETAMPPHFLLDLEIQDLHTVDHAALAQSIFQGITLAPPPFRIALFGPWGSGKSTILKMVQSLIEEVNNTDDDEAGQMYFRPLWFNAWEYESDPNLLMSLLNLLTSLVPDGVRYSRKGSRAIRQAVLSTEYLGQRWSRVTGRADHATVSQALSEPPEAGSEPTEVNHVVLMKDAFRRIVDFGLVHAPRSRMRRMVIFVDDLDKCQPVTVLAFLESIKLFLGRETPLVLVFALDNDVLRNAIAQKYAPQHNFDTDRYLEKIFEFSYDVPPITIGQIKPLIGELYERAGLARYAVSAQASLSELEAMERVLSHPSLSLSPRRIKRIFNKFVWFLASQSRLPITSPRRTDSPQVPLPGTMEAQVVEPEDAMPAIDYWLTWLLTGEYFRAFRALVLVHGEPAVGELCNRVTGNPLFPHANQVVRQQSDALPDLNKLLDYFRMVFNVSGSAHLPQVQVRMRERVAEFVRIDRVLQLNGI